MGPAAILNILITANNKQAMASLAATDAALKKSAVTAQSAAATQAASFQRTGQTLSRVGSSITRWVGLPAAAAGAASVKMAMDFEDSMMKIQNLAKVNQQTMEEWSKELLAMGPRLGKSPRELAEALYFIRSSGIKAADSLEVLEITAKASAIGLGETQVVADAVTSAMNAYRHSHLTAAEATNILAKAVRAGKGEPEELAASIGRVIPVASKLKIPFNDVGATLAGLTLQGLDAAEATTAFRGVLMATLKPAAQSEEALASVGLSAEKIRQSLEQRGTLATLQMLSERFKGNEESVAKVFPNVRALVGAFNLTGDAAKRNAQIFTDLNKNTDVVGKGFARLEETDAFKFRQAMAGLETAGIKLGAALLPVVVKIANAFAGLANVFARYPDWAARLLIGAIVLGPIIKFVGWIYKMRAAWITVQQAAIAAGTAQTAATGAGARGAGGLAGGVLGLVAAIGAYELYSTRARDAAMQTQHFEEQYQGSVDAIIAQSDKLNATQLQNTREWLFGLAQSGKVSGQWAVAQINALDKAAAAHRTYQDVVAQISAVGLAPLQRYGSAVAKLAEKVIAELGKVKGAAFQLTPAVGSAFSALVDMFHNKFGKMAGITKLQMANVVAAMQQGPEQGRQAMVKVFDQMVQNLRDKMKAGKLTVEEGMAAIRKIVLKELALFGISGPGTWKAVTGPGPVAFDLGQNPPKVPKKAFGGIVPGHGTGDKVPVRAMVEPGEALAVLNKNAAQKWMQWNSAFPRFQKGGAAIPVYSGRSPGAIDDLAAAGLNIAGNAARELLKKMAKRAGGPASWRTFDALAKKFHLSITSAFRPGDSDSFHGISIGGGRARATDYSGTSKGMMGFATLMRDRYVQKLAELFYDPLGGWDNGVSIGPIGGHTDHVHVALQKGGAVVAAQAAHAAGFRHANLIRAVAEAGGESHWRNDAVGDSGNSRGMWQLHLPSHPELRGKNLRNPFVAARAAYRIWQSEGWGAWHADHTPYIAEATRAVEAFRRGTADHGRGEGMDPKDKWKTVFPGIPEKTLLRLHRELLPQALATLKTRLKMAAKAIKAAKKTKSVQDDIAAQLQMRGARSARSGFMKKLADWQKDKDPLGRRNVLEALIAAERALQPKLGEPAEPTTPVEDARLAELNALLKTQALTAQQRLAVSQAQYKTLRSTPYVGPFQGGGVVPGVGAKLATVHGGEMITPKGGATTVILIEDGAVDARRIKTLSGAEAQRAIKRSARRGNRPLPSRGGGI